MMGSITAVSIGLLASVIYSICVHEAAHAYTASALGDPTPRRLGRCTLNPIPHIRATPFATLFLPLISWGLSGGSMVFGGGACPVDVRNLKNPRRDDILVSAAGPLSNLLLCVLGTILILIPGLFPQGKVGFVLLLMFSKMNLILFCFNLLPAPPLDGSRILLAIAPESERFFRSIMSYGEYIPIVAAMVIFRYLAAPLLNSYDILVGTIYNAIRM